MYLKEPILVLKGDGKGRVKYYELKYMF